MRKILNLKVGIIVNKFYNPSRQAGDFIAKTLRIIGIKYVYLCFNDLFSKNLSIDIAFNVYYGEIGDSGLITGILNSKNIKVIGNDQLTSSLMWNKVISKNIFSNCGYLTPDFWQDDGFQTNPENILFEIEKKIAYPVIIKPVCGAASENVALFNNHFDLLRFISENINLFSVGYYFAEQFIEGKELSAGYINAIGKLLPIAEISLKNGNKFQSNKVKFSSSEKDNIIPAKIEQERYDKIQEMTKNLHDAFNCAAFSRTDFIYCEKNEKIYVLEINTNPGLLEYSLLPLMAKAIGIMPNELFLKLINYALK